MARVLSTTVVLALLAATAAAFALTEGAKLERSPVAGTKVDPIFSPAGRTHPVAHIDFRIRKPERIRVWVEDGRGREVRQILSERPVRAGSRLRLVWDGFSETGVLEPDGVYTPVVKLFRSHRTIVLPSPITLDTKPPAITVRKPQYPILSPDGDGHADAFHTTYRLSEPGNAILLVRGKQTIKTRCCKTSGAFTWTAKKNGRGLAPGRYLLAAAAQDLAGNRSKGVPFAIAQIRYVVLARTRVVIRAGGRFALRVSTDAPTVRWRLNGRSGVQPRGTLRFRAPRSRGVYRLYVEAAGHAAICIVVVA